MGTRYWPDSASDTKWISAKYLRNNLLVSAYDVHSAMGYFLSHFFIESTHDLGAEDVDPAAKGVVGIIQLYIFSESLRIDCQSRL